MAKREKISYEIKLKTIEQYLNRQDSLNHLATLLDVATTSVQLWLNKYQALGPEGLKDAHINLKYSKSLKSSAIHDYLTGMGSYMEICKKYSVKSTSQLRNWVKRYNGHNELKASATGGTLMTKGRTTTFEEKVEAVKYCIEHDHNYTETSEKFSVSYQQVRSWTVKYEDCGVEALEDRRGKRKFESEMSEFEKLKAQNKLLEAQNHRLELENEFLKKLKELERGW